MKARRTRRGRVVRSRLRTAGGFDICTLTIGRNTLFLNAVERKKSEAETLVSAPLDVFP
jgi:hypothetical protein